MLKTNRLKTLLVLLTTVLGLTGVQAGSYADNAADRKTVGNMALTFARYSAHPTLEALNWADKNTTGKAYDNPYRHRLPNKDPKYLAGQTPYDIKVKLVSVKVNRAKKSAVAIVQRDETPGPGQYRLYLQKVGFKLLDGSWKISDYYVLLSKATRDGKPINLPKIYKNAKMPGTYPWDKFGTTKFPY